MVVMILFAVYHGWLTSLKIVFFSIGLRLQNKKNNVCSVYKCYSNKAGHQTKPAFKILEDLERRRSWLKFLNRKDLSEDMNSFSEINEPCVVPAAAAITRCKITILTILEDASSN